MMTCRDNPRNYYTAANRFSWPIVNAVWDVFTIYQLLIKVQITPKTYYVTTSFSFHEWPLDLDYLIIIVIFFDTNHHYQFIVFNVFTSGAQSECKASSLTYFTWNLLQIQKTYKVQVQYMNIFTVHMLYSTSTMNVCKIHILYNINTIYIVLVLYICLQST